MKTCQISGVELGRLKILSDVLNGKLTLKKASYGLHLSYRQALEAKRVEEVVSGGVNSRDGSPLEPIPQGVVLN